MCWYFTYKKHTPRDVVTKIYSYRNYCSFVWGEFHHEKLASIKKNNFMLWICYVCHWHFAVKVLKKNWSTLTTEQVGIYAHYTNILWYFLTKEGYAILNETFTFPSKKEKNTETTCFKNNHTYFLLNNNLYDYKNCCKFIIYIKVILFLVLKWITNIYNLHCLHPTEKSGKLTF